MGRRFIRFGHNTSDGNMYKDKEAVTFDQIVSVVPPDAMSGAG